MEAKLTSAVSKSANSSSSIGAQLKLAKFVSSIVVVVVVVAWNEVKSANSSSASRDAAITDGSTWLLSLWSSKMEDIWTIAIPLDCPLASIGVAQSAGHCSLVSQALLLTRSTLRMQFFTCSPIAASSYGADGWCNLQPDNDDLSSTMFSECVEIETLASVDIICTSIANNQLKNRKK